MKNDVLLKCRCILADDGWDMSAVFDLREGDKDDSHWLPGLFGLVVVVKATIIVDYFIADASFIWTVVTLRFFFDGDTISYVARNE